MEGQRKDKNHIEGLPVPDLPCLTSEDPVSLFHNLWGDRGLLICLFLLFLHTCPPNSDLAVGELLHVSTLVSSSIM